uniref:Uncharacterized protein n=1 Tax=Clytia hemisphaerica TaxID=252671 RepID=A0A7M5XAV2_9CNID
SRNSNLSYAHDLLVYFVNQSVKIYDKTFPVYNVHNLIHLKDDSEMFNCSLDEISSFPFEDYLQIIKKFVRKAQNPLSQIGKRILELEVFNIKERKSSSHKVVISTRGKDSWFILRSEHFLQIKEVLRDGKIGM